MEKVQIILDSNGHKVVQINEIVFMGKQNIDWNSVENYAKRYIGKIYSIASYCEEIHIGTDFPDEVAHSHDTERLRGGNAKAKANAIQGMEELIEIANNRRFVENFEKKHEADAKYGWYRYDSRFSLPIMMKNQIIKYNIFIVTILIRHDKDSKKYLYDIVNIKKKQSIPLRQKPYGHKPVSFL